MFCVDIQRMKVLFSLSMDVAGEALSVDVPFVVSRGQVLARDEVSGMSRLQWNLAHTCHTCANSVY